MTRRRRGLAVVAALAPALVLLAMGAGVVAGATATAAVPDVRVGGHPPALPRGSVVTGPAPASTTVTSDVSLEPRDEPALAAFVDAVSTPGSPEYHRYLKPGQFASVFGPTQATITSTRQWLASTGLRVGATTPDGLLVPVTGTVSAMERAFSVSVVDARLPTGRQSRFVASAPAVPAALAPSIQGVIGLSTVAQPQPELVRGDGGAGAGGGATSSAGAPTSVPAGPHAAAATPHAGPAACTNASAAAQRYGGYTADQLASIYGLSTLYGDGLEGTGQTVGIYELEPYTQADISTYLSCFGLTNPVNEVAVDGGSTAPQSGEAALDIEGVAGLAPGASVLVYEGNDSTASGPLDTYDAMVSADTANVLTTSWGTCEPEMDPAEQAAQSTIFAEAATQGQTVVAASGDSGSTDCYSPLYSDADAAVTVDDPADQPGVTGVGGTSLLGAGPDESVWNNGYGSTGGGVSSDFAQPAWQAGPGVGAPDDLAQCSALGRSSCREVPDVAASADPAHGDIIYYGGSWIVYGGTSAASPVWAAMTAVIDQTLPTPAGLIDPVLYGAATCVASPFNDVTTGNNAWIAAAGGRYPATADYDTATGWGSANAAELESALVSPKICPVVQSVNPAKGAPGGGNTVIITGTDFAGATAVRFGSTPVAFTVTSPTTITVAVPPGPSGSTVDVTVQGTQGSSRVVSSDRYTYAAPGYWLAASDGGIFTFGRTGFFGSTGGIQLNRPVVGVASSADDGGYWLVASDGGVFTFGDAGFYGSTGALRLNKPIVGMAATTDGRGYWLVASDGGVFSFGDARFYGSTGAIHLNKPIVGMAATPDGRGYWLVASDGGVFTFGDARFDGSTGAIHLNQPVVGLSSTVDGRGYWLVASDGGIFTFGDARFDGSTGAIHLNKPIVGMAATPDGRGYWLVASDGGVFTFGDAGFYGSTGALRLNEPIVGMTPT